MNAYATMDSAFFRELDRDQAREEALDAFVERFKDEMARPWKFENHHIEQSLRSLFADALMAIADDQEADAHFARALHSLWSGYRRAGGFENGVVKALDQAINKIAERQFEKTQ